MKDLYVEMIKKQRVYCSLLCNNEHPIFSDKNLVLHLAQFLPIISLMSLKRAIPQIPIKNLVELTWQRLISECPPAELALRYQDGITGSILLKILLGSDCTWTPGDVDIIRDIIYIYPELSQHEDQSFTDYGYGGIDTEFITGVHTIATFDGLVQLICLRSKIMISDYVDSFDFSFLKNYLMPDKLVIKFPHRILTSALEQVIYPNRRVEKYQERGFRFNIKN